MDRSALSQGAATAVSLTEEFLIGTSKGKQDTPFDRPGEGSDLFSVASAMSMQRSTSLDIDFMSLPPPPPVAMASAAPAAAGGPTEMSWQSVQGWSLDAVGIPADAALGSEIQSLPQSPAERMPSDGLVLPTHPNPQWIEYSRTVLEIQLRSMWGTWPLFHGQYLLLLTETEQNRPGRRCFIQFAHSREEEVVIKFFLLHSDFAREREAHAALRVHGCTPAVITLHDCDPWPPGGPRSFPFPPCVVTEKGQTLSEWCESDRSLGAMLAALQDVARALEGVHSAGYVHRGIKPGSILCRPEGRGWTLVNFDRAVRTGTAAGPLFSPKYSPPEVLRAYYTYEDRIPAASAVDIWALGIVMFEMLTGELALPTRGMPPADADLAVQNLMLGDAPLPWEGGALSEGARQRLDSVPGLKDTVLQCLRRDAALRPTARRLREALGSLEAVPADAPGLSVISKATASTGWAGSSVMRSS